MEKTSYEEELEFEKGVSTGGSGTWYNVVVCINSPTGSKKRNGNENSRGRNVNEEAEELDFDAIREPWCKYRIEDGTLLRIKPVLKRVRKRVEEEPSYNLEVENINRATQVPERLLGEPTDKDYSPDVLGSSIIRRNLGFDTESEE